MPCHRLPNTDSGRIMALKSAVEKAVETDFQELSFSTATLEEAKGVLSHFERLHTHYQQLYKIQVNAGDVFAKTVNNAHTYVSHFIQVLYMCVIRAEIKEELLALYGLESTGMAVPDLTTDEQLLEWGAKIIQGEYRRIAQGGVPIYNPSIAKVNVIFALFKEGYQTLQLHQNAATSALQKVTTYRETVDQIIFEIWEEVEKNNISFPPDKQLVLNREYGIVYS